MVVKQFLISEGGIFKTFDEDVVPFSSNLIISGDVNRDSLYSDAGTTPVADGGTVQQWNTPQGNLSQSTAGRRPTYRATGLNGGPCLEFDGGDEMVFPTLGTVDKRDSTLLIAGKFGTYSNAASQVLFRCGTDALNIYNNNGWQSYDGSTIRGFAATANRRADFWKMIVRFGSSSIEMRVSGNNSTYYQLGATAAASQTGTFNFAGNLCGGNGVSFAPANTKIARFAFYNRRLTDSECDNEAMTWLNNAEATPNLMDATATPKLVVFDGNSLTSGFGLLNPADPYPAQVLASLGATWRGVNVGFPSQQTPELITQAATRVDRFYNPSRTKNVVVVWEATNHIQIGGATAQQAHDSLQTYVQARQAVGWKVVVLNVLPRASDNDTTRASVNTLINANTMGYNALSNVAANSSIGDNGDETDTTYYQSDQVHLTATGAGVVSGLTATAIGTV